MSIPGGLGIFSFRLVGIGSRRTVPVGGFVPEFDNIADSY